MGKLYVGNLPWRATEAELKDFFGTFGKVRTASIVTDRDTGRSRGFGFVEMDDADMSNALNANGREFGGRQLRVSEARERAPRSGPGGGGGGGRPPRGNRY